jgi:hypothetical protein
MMGHRRAAPQLLKKSVHILVSFCFMSVVLLVTLQREKLPWCVTDLGSNNSGYYRLQAVLTHRGRSSSSGHYVAWVHQKGDVWLKCDDDQVSPVTSEEVLKLSGGGKYRLSGMFLSWCSNMEDKAEVRG